MYQKSIVNPVGMRSRLGRERKEARTQLIGREKREMSGSQKVCRVREQKHRDTDQ